MYASFCWDCPSCKYKNWESFANEDELYKCRGCERRFYMSFSVEVEEIERYDEDKDRVVEVKMTEIGISRDQGKTWERMPVDTRDLNPKTSPVKPGDLLEHNGEIWEVSLNSAHNRLETRKVGKVS